MEKSETRDAHSRSRFHSDINMNVFCARPPPRENKKRFSHKGAREGKQQVKMMGLGLGGWLAGCAKRDSKGEGKGGRRNIDSRRERHKLVENFSLSHTLFPSPHAPLSVSLLFFLSKNKFRQKKFYFRVPKSLASSCSCINMKPVLRGESDDVTTVWTSPWAE